MTVKASFVLLILALTLYCCNFKDTSRDQEVIHEVEIVKAKLPVSVDVVTALPISSDYLLRIGGFRLPPEVGDPYDFIVNQCVFESSDCILFRACFKGNEYLVRMDKNSGQLNSQELYGASFYNKPKGDGKLPLIANDIDHGVDFYPHFTNRKGDIWIYSISALDYKEEMDALEQDGKIDLNDQTNKAVNLYHSLADDDNPILMLLGLSK